MSVRDFFKPIGSAGASNLPDDDKSDDDEIGVDLLSDASDSESEFEPKNKKPKTGKKKQPVRKYNSDYLAFGFYYSDDGGIHKPLCLVCNRVFANSGMKPSHLKRHLTKQHANLMDKQIEYFESLKRDWRAQRGKIDSYTRSDLAAVEASFHVAYEIAKAKKPYSIGETLIEPCITKVIETVLGPSELAKVKQISLSRRTIARRFEDMARDVDSQLSDQLQKYGKFALQFDESTDIANEAILIGFVRYAGGEKIQENLFCYCSLPAQTTAEEIFGAIDNKIKEYKLDWTNVINLCTDGAPAMTGVKSGLARRIAAVANAEFTSSHCILHREALASKNMSPQLNDTLQLAVKMINTIKSSALRSRVYSAICEDMDENHKALLYHTEVRWLSRGKTLTRLFELRDELKVFFMKSIENPKKRQKKKSEEEKKPLLEKLFVSKLNDQEWMCMLAYLADIFGCLNELNLQTQGKRANCFYFWNKIQSFKKKLALWIDHIKNSNFAMFESSDGLLSGNAALINVMKPIILTHLSNLVEKFNEYIA